MISQLCYGGKTLAEIAGYSTVQMQHMLLLRRDKWGNLVDPSEELPPGVEADDAGNRVIPKGSKGGFTHGFKMAKLAQGASIEEAQAAWEMYLKDNPQLAKLAELGERRKKAREARMNRARKRGY